MEEIKIIFLADFEKRINKKLNLTPLFNYALENAISMKLANFPKLELLIHTEHSDLVHSLLFEEWIFVLEHLLRCGHLPFWLHYEPVDLGLPIQPLQAQEIRVQIEFWVNELGYEKVENSQKMIFIKK